MSITGAQIRAGRALLRWSSQHLADQAKISRLSVSKAEQVDGEPAMLEVALDAIRRELEAGGVVFVNDEDGTTGVLLPPKPKAAARVSKAKRGPK